MNWGSAINTISGIANTVRQAQGIGYNSQVVAARWNTLYLGFNKSTKLIKFGENYGYEIWHIFDIVFLFYVFRL